MKKQLIALALSAGLSAISLPAFAEQDQLPEKKQPVKMTEEQMDSVTAGLIAIGLHVRNNSVTSVHTFASGRRSIAAASVYTRSSQVVGLTLFAF